MARGIASDRIRLLLEKRGLSPGIAVRIGRMLNMARAAIDTGELPAVVVNKCEKVRPAAFFACVHGEELPGRAVYDCAHVTGARLAAAF